MVKAIKVYRSGGPEELLLEEIAAPAPAPGEVLVRNTAIAVNLVDVYHRIGRAHPNAPQFPYIPGSIHAGVVEEPGTSGLARGTRVVCMGRQGAYSEATCVEASRVVRLPGDIDDAQIAAVYARGLAAYYLTHLHHRPAPGDWALVHAAAGGLGQLLASWLAALGVSVIGTVGTPVKTAIAQRAGCHAVLVRQGSDWVDACLRATGGAGVHVAYDSIGRDTIERSLRCLRPGGRAIVCGAASGTVDALPLEWLHANSLSISRPTVATYVRTREQLEVASQAVFDAMRRGILRLHGIERFSLARARDAHRLLESGSALKTPVLIP